MTTVEERVIDLTCSVCEREERGTYSLRVRCSNCGAVGVGVYSKSHEAHADKCPDCETVSLRPTYPLERVW